MQSEPAPRYRDYDPLAWFYNRHWGDAYHRVAMAAIEELAGPLKAGCRVLDVCCGTGQLDRMLADRGCRITGLDGSEEMLRFAARNVPLGDFIVGDARAFRLAPSFDLAVSTFESMNHIPTLAELETVFRNVAAALATDGRFIFDVLTEETYRVEWKKSNAIVEDDNACFVRGGYDPQTRVAHADITMFRLRKNWERSDVTILETFYPEIEVTAALRNAGLMTVSTVATEGRLFLLTARVLESSR
jgi:SAM-dependent methyltransferase